MRSGSRAPDVARGSVKGGMRSCRKRDFVSDRPIDSFASLRNVDQRETYSGVFMRGVFPLSASTSGGYQSCIASTSNRATQRPQEFVCFYWNCIGISYLFLRIRIGLLNLIVQVIENDRLKKADYLTFVPQHLELHCNIVNYPDLKDFHELALLCHAMIYSFVILVQ